MRETERPEVGEKAEGGRRHSNREESERGGTAWVYDQGGQRGAGVGGGEGHGLEALTPSDNNALFPL